MGLFDKFRKKEPNRLNAPVAGKLVSIKEVNDPTFADEILGKGIAVIPSDNKVCAPADGVVETVFHTMHAVTLKTDFGAEILIHIGLETVNLEGKHFTKHVNEGDKVKAGDILVEFDREKIAEAGYDTITPMVICNAGEFEEVKCMPSKNVAVGDTVVEL